MFQVHLVPALSWVASGWCRLTSWAVLFVLMLCVAWATPLSNLRLFQVHPCRHRADVGLQLRSGQRSGQGALLLLWLSYVQGATALGATLDLTHTLASATKGSHVYLWPTPFVLVAHVQSELTYGTSCRTGLEVMAQWVGCLTALGFSVLWGQPWDQTLRIRPHRSDTVWTWKGFLAVCVCVRGNQYTCCQKIWQRSSGRCAKSVDRTHER